MSRTHLDQRRSPVPTRSAITRKRLAVFRVDATAAIGGGHVMRCLALAHALIEIEWVAAFACIRETFEVVPQLREHYETFEVADPAHINATTLAKRWPFGCDVLVVDHYALDASFESTCRSWAKQIVVIDDLADRNHDCDLLVDANLGRDIAVYRNLVPRRAAILAGPSYASMRREFAMRRAASIRRRAAICQIERVYVGFGLTDVGGVTERVVDVLRALPWPLSFDVVVGRLSNSRAYLASVAREDARMCIHVEPHDLVDVMAAADFAVGHAGATSWERCCLGLPAIVLVLSNNQLLAAHELERLGAASIVGSPSKPELAETLAAFLDDLDRYRKMAKAAADVTDGRGAVRVADAISGLVEAVSY